MVGVVVATHGLLGEALLATAQEIVGALPLATTVPWSNADAPDILRRRLATRIDQVEDGDGVLVLCDLFGGSPANLALALTAEKHIEVLCGVNLPMLLKLASARAPGVGLLELARLLEQYGKRHIQLATELLRQQQHA